MIILWDFDGTLADAPGIWSRATQTLLNRSSYSHVDIDRIERELSYGFPWHTPEVSHVELFKGMSFWEFLNCKISSAMVAIGASESIAHSLVKNLREEIIHNHGYQLVPNAIDVLKALSAKGFTHMIASNHIPELSEILDQLEISNYFKAVYTSGMIGFEKPNRHFFDAIFNDVPRDEIAHMIGDSYERDIKGASDVGINGIWFKRMTDDQKADERVSTIRDLSELPDLLAKR